MRVTILGSGTSSGVPVIGCSCPVCTSGDPKDQRTRASAAIEHAGRVILIDTATDLRAQALRAGLSRVDAVLYTHAHADHVHGIDELRAFNLCTLRDIPCYADAATLSRLKAAFTYIFDSDEGESLRPFLSLNEATGPFELLGLTVTPVPMFHGRLPTLGYRVGDFAYLTDCSRVPDESLRLLSGLKLLVLDALRARPHPTHLSIGEALELIARLAPERAALTHLSHQVSHREGNKGLPMGVELAYDGLVFEL